MAPDEEHADTEDRQLCEAHQRWLLGTFVERRVSKREHRDSVKSVDGEHPTGISTKNLCIEQAASNDLYVVIEVFSGSDKPHLHCEARYAQAVTDSPHCATAMSPIPGLPARISAAAGHAQIREPARAASCARSWRFRAGPPASMNDLRGQRV